MTVLMFFTAGVFKLSDELPADFQYPDLPPCVYSVKKEKTVDELPEIYTITVEEAEVILNRIEAEERAKKEKEEAERRAREERERKEKEEAEKRYLESIRANGNHYSVPDVPDFKSWTNYVLNVARSSAQWRILTGPNTWTDANGFRRLGNDYLVAMGSYYTTKLGTRFLIDTTRGEFTVTVCDFKPDSITDATHRYTVANNCITEFYVNSDLVRSVRSSGSCSSIGELSGKITAITKIS